MREGHSARLLRHLPPRIPAVLRRKAHLAGTAAGVVAAVVATLLAPPRPLLIWNVSASAPVGLYAVASARSPARGDLVAARLEARWRIFGSARHYVPANIPLIKRVAAAAGDHVCAVGADISVNGLRRARRLDFDGAGRPMPYWSGCVVLRRGEYLLLMPGPASFDGRYFGPTAESDIVGKVHLLWAR